MRRFTVGFVLLFVIVRHESKEILKRHLVGRFTNNPFFLSHFGGGGDHTNYEIQSPEVHFLTESGPYEYNNDDDDYEEYEESPYSAPFAITNDDQNHITEDTKTQTEEPIFNALPFYDKKVIFQPWQKILQADQSAKKEEQKHLATSSGDGETTLYVFKSLPHFHNPYIFRRKVQIVKVDNSTPYTFVEKPGNVVASEENEEVVVAYVSTSKPKLGNTNIFKEKEDVKVETTSQNLFEEKPQKVVPSQENENKYAVYVFTSLPHFDIDKKFHEAAPIPSGSKTEESIPVSTTSDFANLDLPPFFANLPNFEPEKKFLEPNLLIPLEREPNEPTLFVPNIENVGTTEATIDVRFLPKFEDADFKVIQNGKIMLVSRVTNKEPSEEIIIVPNSANLHAPEFRRKTVVPDNDAMEGSEDNSELANFHTVQPVEINGRKKVRVVRRKKLGPPTGKIEFGRRLRPRIRSRRIADLPLETATGDDASGHILDSYGAVLPPKQQ